jgi:DHA2 family methylenomycin A resistance protein-like MFS transporter
LLLPTSLAIISRTFAGEGQARAIGVWAGVGALALPAGPLLGGLLVDWVGWRAVFWINVPLTAAAVLATVRVVPDLPGRHRRPVDVPGLAGLVVGLAALVYTVIAAGHGEQTTVVLVAALLAALAFATAALAESRASDPVLPVTLLTRRDFLSPNVVALTMNLVFNGLLFVIMLFLQDVRHDSALVAGLTVLPLAVPLVLLAPVSGRLAAAHGPRRPVAIGCATAAVGALCLLGLDADGGIGWLLVGFGVLGVGAGLVTASVVAAVVQATPPERSGLATGMSNTSRQTGTATGVAIFGAVAGSPARVGAFVTAVHALAVTGAVLWLIALLLTVFGVARRPR